MWHNCRSIGKYWRFIGHEAVIVNLEEGKCYAKFCWAKLSFSLIFIKTTMSTAMTTSSDPYRILLVIEPEWCTRMNSLLVVAMWKYDCFSFTKNVSGTQILFTKSDPTDSCSTPGRFLYASRGSVQNCRK